MGGRALPLDTLALATVALVLLLAGGVTAKPSHCAKDCKQDIKSCLALVPNNTSCTGTRAEKKACRRMYAAQRKACRGMVQLCKQQNPSLSGTCVLSSTTTTSTTTPTTSPLPAHTTTTTLVPGCFTDTGDGTIHDTCTGLQWEKKTTTAGLQNVDNVYTWVGCCNGNCSTAANYCQPNAAAAATCAAQEDGGTEGCSTCVSGTCNVDPFSDGALTTVWDWVNQVNAATFAGHSDWRLPSEGGCNSCVNFSTRSCSSCSPHELETILRAPYPCDPGPCIDSIFGPRASGDYWSASTYSDDPRTAWSVAFSDGIVFNYFKDGGNYVRAVRGTATTPSTTTTTTHPTTTTTPSTTTTTMTASTTTTMTTTHPTTSTTSSTTTTITTSTTLGSGCLPATGQTTCSDSNGYVIQCAGTGHDGDTRTGAPLSYTDNGDGTVTDNVTGLMWEKQSNGDGSVHDIANPYTWDQAFSGHVATLNTGTGFAGHTDWRVPNVRELQSIANYQNVNPAVSLPFNTNCTAPCTVLTCSCTAVGITLSGTGYWSSSSYAGPGYTADAWNVDFSSGGVYTLNKSQTSSHVRGVRSGSSCLPATGQMTCWDSSGNVVICAGTGHDGDTRTGAPLSYTDNGDGTVTDNVTGLMWEKQSMGDGSIHDIGNPDYDIGSWNQAFSGHVTTLNTGTGFAGHTDWRVPNVRELQSIANYQNFNPDVSPAFNTNCTAPCTVLTCSCTGSYNNWSSSSYEPGYTASAWGVLFNFGYVTAIHTSGGGTVRGVRGGS